VNDRSVSTVQEQ